MYDLWLMNRVTVFYLCECTEGVSQKEVATNAQEEMSGQMDKKHLESLMIKY